MYYTFIYPASEQSEKFFNQFYCYIDGYKIDEYGEKNLEQIQQSSQLALCYASWKSPKKCTWIKFIKTILWVSLLDWDTLKKMDIDLFRKKFQNNNLSEDSLEKLKEMFRLQEAENPNQMYLITVCEEKMLEKNIKEWTELYCYEKYPDSDFV